MDMPFDHLEASLDMALDLTFPASDPVAIGFDHDLNPEAQGDHE